MCQTLQNEKINSRTSLSGKFLNAFFGLMAFLGTLNASAQCTCPGNLVQNPSFESGTTSWSWSGGTLSAGTGAVACGTKSGDFQISNTSSNGVSQTIGSGTIPAGSTITLNVYAGTHDNSFYHDVKIMYFTSSWGWISQTSVEVNKVLANSPVGPQLYTLTSTVPANAYYVQVGFSGTGSWIKTDGWCSTVSTPPCDPNDAGAYYGFCAPTPNCTSGAYTWQQTIDPATGNPSIVKLISGSTNTYTINSGLPSAFSSSVNINVDDVVSYDGYSSRNTVSQTNERWRLVFKRLGSVVYSTPYTNDVPDWQKQGYWRGALGTTFNAPNGIDEILIEHYDVVNGYVGPGSVVPASICLSYTSGCAATINGLQFKDPTGANTSVLSISNGGTYSISNLPNPFNVEALLSGNMESVRFTLSGSASGSNIENAYTWDYAGTGSTWPHGAGTFTMLVEAFPQDNAVGSVCASQSYTFTLLTCDNVTSGGTIGYDETLCGTSADPALIQNLTSPSGGTGALEYMWLISYDGGASHSAIAGANGATYDPPVITQTTWYRRCARRAGCSGWPGESNWIQKSLSNCCSNVTAGGTIGYDEIQCGTSVDPSLIQDLTPASGGTGTLEYMWLISYDGGTTHTVIAGANGATYDPPVITQTTWYRRCARRSGCSSWPGESNWVKKDLCPLPIANAGADKNLTCTTTSTSIGTSAVAGLTYSWAPSAGLSASNVAQPNANPISTTSYTVTVTNSCGCTATDVVVVNVNTTPPTANGGSGGTITCTSNTSGIQIGSAAVAGNTYSWLPATGLSATNIAQPTANPASTTTYTVTVTGSNGCTATATVTINVNKTVPSADAGADKNLNCTTTSTTIGTSGVVGNSYSWSPASGLSSTTVAQPIANPTTTTTYTVTVTNAASGCTSTDVVVVNVNTTPPTANAGLDKTLNCTTTSTQIGSAAIAGNTYSWSPSNGLSATNVAQPMASPSMTTSYTVTVTGSNGCTASDVVLATVDAGVPTADAGPDKTVNCTTNSVTIGTQAIPGYTYSWLPNGMNSTLSSTTVAQPTANPTSTTTYTVIVTAANGCTASDVVTVNVNTTPPAADAGPDKDVCSLNSVVIGTPAIAGNSYSWSPSNGLSATNVAQPFANPGSTTSYTVTVTAANGCTSTDVVTVNFREGSVGNFVWNDVNGDGIYNESSSEGINGVQVELWSVGTDNMQGTGDDQLLQSTVTANNNNGQNSVPGFYNFKICTSGNYYVKFPTSTNANNTLTTQTATAGTDNNSDANTSNGMSPVFNINTAGTGVAKNNNTIDAGFVSYLSLGNQVWIDSDRDGIKDAGESGLAGATINLYADANSDGSPDGPAVATTSSNANGYYVFNNLLQGNYIVGVIPPSPASGNPYASSPVNESNPNNDVDNNDNGITTNSGQTFSGTIILTPGAEPTGETPNNGSATDANSNLTLDFGFYQPVNVSGNVYVDNNGPSNVDGTGTGTAGTTQLYANLVGPNGSVVASVAVNPSGTYQFNDVTPNTTYTMVLTTTPGTVGNPAPSTTLPSEWSNVSEDCCDNTGNDGNTNGQTTVVVANVDVPNVNFGITQPLSLGNQVWHDENRNGLKDANESGISGATVYLYQDADNNGTPDGTSIANTTTNGNGLYIFNGLIPGNYIVGVVPPAPASGNPFVSSTVHETNPNSDVDNNDNGLYTTAGQTYSGTINLSAGSEPSAETPNNASAPDANANLTLDFGFFQTLSIYGNVFVDNNGPTNVDGTGTGTAGTTQLFANLIDANGNVVSSVPVNANGSYQFNDVSPNANYCMVLSTVQGSTGSQAPSTALPAGWRNVSEDCCDNSGNDGTTDGNTCFAVGTTDVQNINFGITQPLSVGNLVWNDVNRDGIKDANESGIENAVVNLYRDENNDCTPDGAAVSTTTTDVNGLYVFTDLIPGKYIVGVVPPIVSGGSYTSSAAGEESNPNLDGDNNDNGTVQAGTETRSCTVTLAAGTEPSGETPNNGGVPDANANLTVDFGFFVCPNNWAPVTVSVCAGTTVNLTTLEPVGYTGGIWYSNGNVVTNLTQSTGSFTYVFTNGTCTASGSVTLVPQIPDYAPQITITPAVINGPKPVRVVIRVDELLNMNSCTPLYVFVPRLEPRYTFSWNPTATQIGTGATGAVNNPDWQYFSTNPNFYVWKYIGQSTFPALGSSKFGYAGVYDPNNTDGVTTFSVQIYQGSGGETNLTNNTDSEELIYFRN